MEQAVMVTLALFMLGLSYHAGRISVRVEKLEEWQKSVGAQFGAIMRKLNVIVPHHLGEED